MTDADIRQLAAIADRPTVSDVWPVVEALRSRGWHFDLDDYTYPGAPPKRWTAAFAKRCTETHKPGEPRVYATAVEPAAAILRAALQAVG